MLSLNYPRLAHLSPPNESARFYHAKSMSTSHSSEWKMANRRSVPQSHSGYRLKSDADEWSTQIHAECLAFPFISAGIAHKLKTTLCMLPDIDASSVRPSFSVASAFYYFRQCQWNWAKAPTCTPPLHTQEATNPSRITNNYVSQTVHLKFSKDHPSFLTEVRIVVESSSEFSICYAASSHIKVIKKHPTYLELHFKIWVGSNYRKSSEFKTLSSYLPFI